MSKPVEQELRETQEALLHASRILSVSVQMTASCALALQEAELLSPSRAQSIARGLRRAAELLDDPDAVEPGSVARKLHRQAAQIDGSARPPRSSPDGGGEK